VNKDFELNLKEHLANKQENELDPISAHFQKNIGDIIEGEPIALSVKNNIFLNACEVANKPYKLLFTVGLCTITDVELYFCLPKEWKINRYLSSPLIEETLPIDILQELIVKLERKNSKFVIEEGVYIDKTKKPWSKLNWDEKLDGLLVLDHSWENNDEETDETKDKTVRLLTFLPVYHSEKKLTKRAIPSIIEAHKNVSIEKTSLPFNEYIAIQHELNEAVTNYDLKKIKEAVEKGADINRGYIDHHFQFGLYTQHSILLKSFYSKNEALIIFLIENGAEVPENALSILSGWGTKNIFEFLLKHGGDVNAEFVNMTPLARAKAFDNEEGIRALLELGANEENDG